MRVVVSRGGIGGEGGGGEVEAKGKRVMNFVEQVRERDREMNEIQGDVYNSNHIIIIVSLKDSLCAPRPKNSYRQRRQPMSLGLWVGDLLVIILY